MEMDPGTNDCKLFNWLEGFTIAPKARSDAALAIDDQAEQAR